MDPTEQKLMKKGSGEVVDERPQAGYLMAGAVVLVIGGLILIMQAHASVADFGGAMLVLIGLSLGAASIWLYSQQPQ